ncbi:phage tail protein [Flavobacterium sp.]|uniref:phage tail protein n=1 Tax=Flavobacterium sp. TaxID=239 RepID=UPI004033A01B
MEEYTGIVKLFAGNFAPRGWMFCEGQLLSTHRFGDLFSLIGTTYGGDGAGSFALPDLRSRAVVGAGTIAEAGKTAYKPGDNGGTEKMILDATHVPDHTHTAKVMVSTTNAADPLPKRTSVFGAPGKGTGRSFEPNFGFIDAVPDMQLADTTVTIDPTTGGGKEFSLMNPYLAMSYIICVEGIYPSRP